MSNPKVGIIGVGVVGGAMAAAFPDAALLDPEKRHCNLDGIFESDVCFVCVPTPNVPEGRQNLSIVRYVFRALTTGGYKGVVALRSTVLPGTTRKLQAEFGLRTVYYPEFLRAAHAAEEFRGQDITLLGGMPEDCVGVWDALSDTGGPQADGFMACREDPAEVEMAKYFHNSFMAVKVSFANEMADVCGRLGIDYGAVKAGAVGVGRIHPGHLDVPGPDGKKGWGGACLPKDTEAFLAEFDGMAPVLEAAVTWNGWRVEQDRGDERAQSRERSE